MDAMIGRSDTGTVFPVRIVGRDTGYLIEVASRDGDALADPITAMYAWPQTTAYGAVRPTGAALAVIRWSTTGWRPTHNAALALLASTSVESGAAYQVVNDDAEAAAVLDASFWADR